MVEISFYGGELRILDADVVTFCHLECIADGLQVLLFRLDVIEVDIPSEFPCLREVFDDGTRNDVALFCGLVNGFARLDQFVTSLVGFLGRDLAFLPEFFFAKGFCFEASP